MNNIKLLKQLISIKSYSGEEDNIRDFIQNWLDKEKIESIVQGENLVVHIKGEDQTRAFIFNSHMDTVSAGDEKQWTYGPWNPTVKGNKLIGLGASDMKSGIAASMLLVKKMSKNKPPIDLWFTYVVREEVDGQGTSSFAYWFKKEKYTKKYKQIAAIFTESTDLIEIEIGHRGNIFLEVEAKGDSGHASRPAEIKIHAVNSVINFSKKLNSEMIKWRKEFRSKIFEPPTAGELTSIRAGVSAICKNGENLIVTDSPNKFPQNCIATFDIRTTPEFHKVAFKRINNIGIKAGVEVRLAYSDCPAGYTSPDSKIVKVASDLLKSPTLTVSQGAADLGFLNSLGVESIILGPGKIGQAHKVNEYCYIDKIDDAVNLYYKIIMRWSKY